MIVRAICLSVPVLVPDEFEYMVYEAYMELPRWVCSRAIEKGEQAIPDMFPGYRVSAVKDVEFECIEEHYFGMTAFFTMRIETR